MTTFLALATLLVVVTAVLLAVPLLRRPRPAETATDRDAANLAIFRDQLAELERERDEGSLSAAAFAQAKSELQRRLLEEVKPAERTGRESAPSRKAAIAVVLLLPLLGLAGYAQLGTPEALDPENTKPQHRVTAGDIESMVDKLAQRLRENPDDTKGWIMLARSYKMLGRYAESAEAYGKIFPAIENEPSLLADYAEMLAISSNAFRGRPTELLERALKLAPEDPQVRLLAGAAAGERGDFAAAVAHWEKALAGVEPGSEEAEALAGAIAQARQAMAGKAGGGR